MIITLLATVAMMMIISGNMNSVRSEGIQGKFEKVAINSSVNLRKMSTLENIRTSMDCLWNCMNHREPPEAACDATYFDTSGRTCQLYSKYNAIVNEYPSSESEVLLYHGSIDKRFENTRLPNGYLISFHISRQMVPYATAKQRCNSIGAHLLYFDFAEEYDAIGSFLDWSSPMNYYMGATDTRLEGVWEWDKTGQQVDSSLWRWKPGGDPNNGLSGNCAMISTTAFVFIDDYCTKPAGYICKL